MATTPSTKRRRQAVPDTPSAAAAELIGRTVLVPAEVFPKEQPPRREGGWKAVVTGINHSEPGTVLVKFPGFGTDQYFFPIEDVRTWLAAGAVEGKQPAAAAAPRSTHRAAATAPVAAAHPSPAKSTAARRSTAAKGAKPGAVPQEEEAGPSSVQTAPGGRRPRRSARPSAAADAAAGEAKRQRDGSAAAAPAGPAHAAAAQRAAQDEIREGDPSGHSLDEQEDESGGEGSGETEAAAEEGLSSDEEGAGEEGRARKRRRAAGGLGSSLRDGVNFLLGSGMTYVLLRWLYPPSYEG